MKNKDVNKKKVEELIDNVLRINKINEAQYRVLIDQTNEFFGNDYEQVQNKNKMALMKLMLYSTVNFRLVKKIKQGNTNSEESKKYVESFYTQYKNIYDSTTQSWELLDMAYLILLRDLSSIDYKGIILDELSKQAQEINKKYNSSYPLMVYRYLEILFNKSKYQNNHCSDLELEKTIKESEEVIKSLSVDINEGISNKEEFIEYILFDRRLFIPNEEDDEADNVINQWLLNLSKVNLFHNTRYTILTKYISNFASNTIAIKKLLNVYRHIQNIKYQVVVRDFSDLEFGHYTTGDTLQKLLEQDENNSSTGKYKIKGKTRLYNVGYMNDPEEGQILNKVLGLEQSFHLGDEVSSSSWFLMSMSAAIDELTMWSQYGDNAEGVCLVLKPDSFSTLNSYGDLEWFKGLPQKSTSLDLKPKRNTKKDNSKVDSSSSSTKDYLYRVCYLDEDALKNGDIKIHKEHNKLLKEDVCAISKIENSLKQMQEDIGEGYKDEKLYKEQEELYDEIDKLLEEIRYLFKSSAYSYEKELRLLKYSELKPDTKDIKVQNMYPAAKLYLERDNPIQLKRIIFGPKFKEPENITPLVHLLDKDIICKRSSKKFR